MRKIYAIFFTVVFAFVVDQATAQFSVSTNSSSGLAATYTSLANAITALNGATITAPVVITVTAGAETAPANGYQITATGTVTNTITISGGGFTVTANDAHASTITHDAIFKIIGGDYITLENFVMTENSLNTVGADMTEFGVALFNASTTNGAQNNTIQNNTITLSSSTVYHNTIGIFSTSASSSTGAVQIATTNAGTNSNNKIYGNTITGVQFGAYFIGPTATAALVESGNDVGGTSLSTKNTITIGVSNVATGFAWQNGVFTTIAGVSFRNSFNANCRFNTINSNTACTLSMGGILGTSTTPAGQTYTNNFSDNTINLTSPGLVNPITGIDMGAGLATAGFTASNNNITISQTAATGAVTAAAILIGINANLASAAKTINGNTISILQPVTTSATF
ncbi:MAG: hypothetical protein ACOYLO_14545, partial [Ferruginibacter sp.]